MGTKIKSELLKDIFITAVESGACSYWATFKNYNPGRLWSVLVRDVPEGDESPILPNYFKICERDIQRGIDLIAENKLEICSEYIAMAHLIRVKPEHADYDGSFADCVIQAALFKKLIFG